MTTMSLEAPTTADVDAILQRAIHAFQDGHWSEALKGFDAVARLRPHRNDIHNYRARSYERLGRLEDALECLDRALAIDQGNVADLRNRGVVLRRLERLNEAAATYERLLAIQPNDLNALVKYGLLLNQLDRREDALASVDEALRLFPDDFDALNARVMVLDNLGRYEHALTTVDRMLALRPTDTDAINNTGMLLARLGRFEEALRCYDASLALRSDQAQARYNRSLVRLALGDWARGFQEFESRWETDSLKRSRPSVLAPLWLGEEDLTGKTLLLYHEQGYGDALQCVRYIPLLAERGARVLLAVPEGLRKLLETVRGVDRIISNDDTGLVHHLHCPLMSLPLAFRTTPETVPAEVPYVSADPFQVARWKERLGRQSKPRIGVVWGGRRYAPINYPRDVPLAELQSLLKLDAEFISLQKELSEGDRALLNRLPQVRQLGEELGDFAATAALIQNLDLVIAADTAVAHLAGALGKPVWLMNRYASCWRWMRSGTHSVWYPTMRQFRQRTVGDWNSVTEAVLTAGRNFLKSPQDASISLRAPRLGLTAATQSDPGFNPTPREKVRFVCATRLSKTDFFAKSALGRSLPLYRAFPKDQVIELRLFPENACGLAEIYNIAIEEARADPAVLIFIHDDVYLSDFYWADHLHRALERFDLVGLVGNRHRARGQASWMYLDDRFTCDSYDNFSGVLGHGEPFPDLRQLSVYGPPGLEVKLLDGVLLAIRSEALQKHGLRFDPRFHFHFYDMDFCRQAELRGLRMGTCAMSLVHASAGELGNRGWRSAYEEYLLKYDEG